MHILLEYRWSRNEEILSQETGLSEKKIKLRKKQPKLGGEIGNRI